MGFKYSYFTTRRCPSTSVPYSRSPLCLKCRLFVRSWCNSAAVGAVAATFLLLLGWTVEAAIDQEALELVWYDDFEGSSVDWDKWIVDKGDGCDVGLCDWGNGEEQVSEQSFLPSYHTTVAILSHMSTFTHRVFADPHSDEIVLC